jgi:ATP-binding cassette subfamily B protein
MNPARLIRELATYTPKLFLLTGTGVLLAAYLLPLVPGLIIQRFFDDLSEGQSAGANVWTMLALLAAFGIVRSGVFLLSGWAEPMLAVVASSLLRRNMLQHILQHPGARAVPVSTGEAVSRFRDDVQAATKFLCWTFDPIGQVLMTLIAIIILWRIDPILTLGVFIPLLLVVALVTQAGAKVARFRKANQAAIGNVTGLLGEMFGAVQAVKATGTEREVVQHFREVNDRRRAATLQDKVFSEFLHASASNIANIGVGVILLLAASKFRDGEFTVGDFSLFVSYLGGLAVAAGFIGDYLTQWRQIGVSVDRMHELMPDAPANALVAHQPVYLTGPLPDLPPLPPLGGRALQTLEMRNLSYTFPETGRGIADISFTIPRGTMTVVTGRIGSGKTTLVRTLLGLLPHQQGQILWNGEVVTAADRFFVPPIASYTPQNPRLFGESLRTNILLGLDESAVDLPAAIHAAVLEQDVPTLDHGLDTLVGNRGVKLSGGQIQRSATARMFVRPAELYVVDDVSSALDVDTEALLWDRLFAREGVTSLVVSHRRPALQRADQIIVMDGGRIAAIGTLAELMESSPLLRNLWHGHYDDDLPPLIDDEE